MPSCAALTPCAPLQKIRLRKKQIVIAHRMKKGAAGRQAMLPTKADGMRKRTTANLKVSYIFLYLPLSLSQHQWVTIAVPI